jgi:hypothetical protein
MKNLLSFSKGSQASHDEMLLVEKIRVQANRYAAGETAQLLIALVSHTKLNGPPRKISRLLDLAPVDYDSAVKAAFKRLQGDQAFNNLFHFIRATCEEVEAEIPRFPAALPYTP